MLPALLLLDESSRMLLAADTLWLGLTAADWVVLAGYFLLILIIGLWSMSKVKDMADYFMGGRRFGKVFMMFFAFGAGTSSEQAISVVAGTWRVGLAGIWWQFLWLWATPFYWIVAPVMRRMRALTTADFFEHRFHSSTSLLYSIYGIVMSVVFIAGGLYGAGQMVNALTGGELDVFAKKLDWQVPEVRGLSGRGVLFNLEDEGLSAQLKQGEIPAKVLDGLAARKLLSDDLNLAATESGWTIEDKARGVNYPLAETVNRNDDGNDVTMIRVYSSGWRRVKGYEFAILAMTVLFVLYGMAGGLGAAIITDFIQGVLTITFSFLLLPFVFNAIGGFGELHSEGELKPGMFDFVGSAEVAATLGKEPITIFYVFMLSLTALTGIVVQPHIMGVCGAGKTEFEGRFGFTFGNFLKRFCTIAWTFTGLACIVWYLGSNSPLQHQDAPQAGTAEFAELSAEDQNDITNDRETYRKLKLRADANFTNLPASQQAEIDGVERQFADELFGKAAYDILPGIMPGLVGLLLASLLAAVMSTSDAQMVVSSGLFTENIYRRYIAKNKSQGHYLWVGRFAGLLIVLVALVLQASFEDVIGALKVILKTPALIGISLWFGIVWRGWTTSAVWVSTLTATATWFYVGNYGPAASEWLPETMFRLKSGSTVMLDAWQMVCYLTAGTVAGIVTSLLTPRVREDKLDHFFRLLHTPIRPGEEVHAPCTLPDNPLPPNEKMFNSKDIELPKPTAVGIIGFVLAWACVGLIVWLTGQLVLLW